MINRTLAAGALLTHAPLELKKATEPLNRASQMQDKGEPVTDNATETNRALNRRVEIHIPGSDQPVKPRR